uniref:Uncharacterized protein AlNc14C22G2290 n=1 Tax=Albugo laibachii Nc14 TaxID=890382 RepID=F0W5Y2_9STRA|nr:conserved hypothetical protein [Albugo laibachii Nc14]|eukprot:CCA16523.1 conserved hypothetical protein [Albugo laibachii Nc14]
MTLRRNSTRLMQTLEKCDATTRIAENWHEFQRSNVRVLGIDINTNSTGLVVLNESGKLDHCDKISTASLCNSDIVSIGHRIEEILIQTRDKLQGAQQLIQPDKPIVWFIGIEDFMRAFVAGRFHTKGLIQLAQLNGIVSYSCWQNFDAKPTHYHPTLARSYFGLSKPSVKSKTDNFSKQLIKDIVLEYVQDLDPLIRQSMTSTRTGRPTEQNYDIADAYIIALYTYFQRFQDQIQCDELLLSAFIREYGNRLNEVKKSVEAKRVAIMTAEQQEHYLRNCFANAVELWFKKNYMQILSSH